MLGMVLERSVELTLVYMITCFVFQGNFENIHFTKFSSKSYCFYKKLSILLTS